MSLHKYILFTIMACIVLAACNLPFGTIQSSDPSQPSAPKFTITPQATKTIVNQPTGQGGSQPGTQPGDQPASQPVSSQPTPTQIPPQPPSQPQPQNPLQITDVSLGQSGYLHYGTCMAGEATLLTISAKIGPANRVKSVDLRFVITNINATTILTDGSISMILQNNGKYEATLDMQTEAAPFLGGTQDGLVNFFIEATE